MCLPAYQCFHVLRHLLIRQQAGREVMELIAVMRHPPLGHFLLKTDGVHNDGDGIIGSALDSLLFRCADGDWQRAIFP